MSPARPRVPLTREAILRTSAVLFRRDGFRATSLEQVAAELEVTRPALYYHFRSKAAILHQIQYGAVRGLFAATEPALTGPGSASERFWAGLHAHIEYVATQVDEVAAVFEAEGELGPVEAERLRSERIAYADRFVEVYDKAIADGGFAATDAHLATYGYLGAATWLYRWYRPEPGREPADVAREMLVALRGPGPA